MRILFHATTTMNSAKKWLRVLLAAALCGSSVLLVSVISAAPATAGCEISELPPYGEPSYSPLRYYGQELHRYTSTCNGDGFYAGKVSDHPWIRDGRCAIVQVRKVWDSYSGTPVNGTWRQHAYSCTSRWKSYNINNAQNYEARLCSGYTSICSPIYISGA